MNFSRHMFLVVNSDQANKINVAILLFLHADFMWNLVVWPEKWHPLALARHSEVN